MPELQGFQPNGAWQVAAAVVKLMRLISETEIFTEPTGIETRHVFSQASREENIALSCTQGRFRLDFRRDFFTKRGDQILEWTRMSREVIKSPSLCKTGVST